MLDPSNMYPESFHPAEIDRSRDFRRKAIWYSRTRRPTKYLLIDFGLSRRYDPANGPPLDKPYRGGDKSAPEHQDMTKPCNPFPTDVYYLGNLIRENFMQVQVFLFPPNLTKLIDKPRNTKVSSSWNLSWPTWSKMIPRSVLPWTKLSREFLRSRVDSVRGSCDRG